MGSVCHEGSLLTASPHCCSLDVEGKEQASRPRLAFLLDGVLQVFAQACVQRLAALASRTAVERQLPTSADTRWIWRLFFSLFVHSSAFLVLPSTSCQCADWGKTPFCGTGQRTQLPRVTLICS